jgi:hypothetical protein
VSANQSPRKRGQRSKQKRQKPKVVDLWRPVPQLEPPAPVVPVADPAALLRSLGDPPLQGQGAVADHYLAAVVERAASVAVALAASAGLFSTGDDDGGGGQAGEAREARADGAAPGGR